MTQPTEKPAEAINRVHIYSPGRKLCGRAVRYVTLSIDDLDNIELQIVRGAPEITRLELRRRVADDIMLTSIREVSDPVPMLAIEAVKDAEGKVITPARQEPDWANAKWRPMDAATLELQKNKLFKTKDMLVLRAIFSDEYDVTQKDLDDITSGKVAELAE